MRNILICMCVLFAFNSNAHSEITLDTNWPWDKGYDPKSSVLRKGTDPIRDAVNRDLKLSGHPGRDFYETLNTFRMIWRGSEYFVAAWQYQSKSQLEQNRIEVAQKAKHLIALPGGGICSLFIYSDTLKLLAKHDVQLLEANGNTWCNGSEALARVKDEDALLFSITYYLTEKPLAKRAQDIGADWRRMTVLLRLKAQGDQVLVEQDDSCLCNPNAYGDIASARAALAKCKSIAAH